VSMTSYCRGTPSRRSAFCDGGGDFIVPLQTNRFFHFQIPPISHPYPARLPVENSAAR
jgi:hypothetical protein